MTMKNKVKKMMNGTYDFCMRNAPLIIAPVTMGLTYAGMSQLGDSSYTCYEQQNRFAVDLCSSIAVGLTTGLFVGGNLRGNQLDKEKAAKAEKLAKERIAKVEAKPERNILSVEELKQKVIPYMKKDGCGCYRYPARAAYNHFSAIHPIEDLRLFQVLDGYLHSYCGNTGSSSTSNNTSVMTDVVRKCNQVITGNSPFKAEAAKIERSAISGLARDSSHSIDEKLVLSYLERSNNGIAKGDLILALSGLDSATVALDNISSSYESSRVIIQPKIDELKDYFPKNLVNICNKKDVEFTQVVDGIGYALSRYDISSKLSENKKKRLNDFVLRNTTSLTVPEELSSKVNNLISDLSSQLKVYDGEKSLEIKAVEFKHGPVLEKAKNHLEYVERQNRSYPSMGNAAQVTKAREEYSLVNGFYEQDKAQAIGVYDSKILEVISKRDNYQIASGGIIAKMNDRTMTKQEYKKLKKLNFEILAHSRGEAK